MNYALQRARIDLTVVHPNTFPMKAEIMKKRIRPIDYALGLFFLFLTAAPLQADTETALQRLDTIAAHLSTAADQLEDLKTELTDIGLSNADYDQQKNIFLAAVMTVSTVAAICSYESDLLTLFTDLKPQNRRYYFEVRRQSLQSSMGQLEIMHRQMKINERLLKLGKKEKGGIEKALGIIRVAIERLQQADRLVADYANAQ